MFIDVCVICFKAMHITRVCISSYLHRLFSNINTSHLLLFIVYILLHELSNKCIIQSNVEIMINKIPVFSTSYMGALLTRSVTNASITATMAGSGYIRFNAKLK